MSGQVVAPSGEQYAISGGGYDAVVTEGGATLRSLRHAGADLIDGFGEHEMPWRGRGQLLAPWPNRIGDGRYSFGGAEHQLPLSEPTRANASHGLVRWAAWTLEEHTAHSVSLQYRLIAQSGYPVDPRPARALRPVRRRSHRDPDGDERRPEPAPYASGAHPYLSVGTGPVDTWELTLPAATRVLADDRLLPVSREPVDDTDYDFRMARPLRDVAMDHGFTDLVRDAHGTATTVVRDPDTGRAVALWVDAAHRWLQVYTADDVPHARRRSIAVEPMTAGADAFRSGDDLIDPRARR